MQQHYNIPLHDIKPLVGVEEYSLYYLMGVGVIIILLLVGSVYLIFRWLKTRNRYSQRKEHYKALCEIDYKDAKRSAYDVTYYGATFKDDSPRHAQMYHNLLSRLEPYKYKKSVDDLEDEVISYIELYKGMIDV